MRELGPLLVSAAEPSADAGGRCAAIGTAAAPARKSRRVDSFGDGTDMAWQAAAAATSTVMMYISSYGGCGCGVSSARPLLLLRSHQRALECRPAAHEYSIRGERPARTCAYFFDAPDGGADAECRSRKDREQTVRGLISDRQHGSRRTAEQSRPPRGTNF